MVSDAGLQLVAHTAPLDGVAAGSEYIGMYIESCLSAQQSGAVELNVERHPWSLSRLTGDDSPMKMLQA